MRHTVVTTNSLFGFYFIGQPRQVLPLPVHNQYSSRVFFPSHASYHCHKQYSPWVLLQRPTPTGVATPIPQLIFCSSFISSKLLPFFIRHHRMPPTIGTTNILLGVLFYQQTSDNFCHWYRSPQTVSYHRHNQYSPRVFYISHTPHNSCQSRLFTTKLTLLNPQLIFASSVFPSPTPRHLLPPHSGQHNMPPTKATTNILLECYFINQNPDRSCHPAVCHHKMPLTIAATNIFLWLSVNHQHPDRSCRSILVTTLATGHIYLLGRWVWTEHTPRTLLWCEYTACCGDNKPQ